MKLSIPMLLLVSAAMMLVVFSSCVRFYAFGAISDDAAAAIAAAKSELADCYDAVLEAEGVGANVSDFLARLNVAGGYLADADVCYRTGNYTGTIHFAELVNENLDGLADEARQLYGSTALERGQRSSLIVAGSVVGIIVIVLVAFLAWGYVARSYTRRVLKMKPEVSKR